MCQTIRQCQARGLKIKYKKIKENKNEEKSIKQKINHQQRNCFKLIGN